MSVRYPCGATAPARRGRGRGLRAVLPTAAPCLAAAASAATGARSECTHCAADPNHLPGSSGSPRMPCGPKPRSAAARSASAVSAAWATALPPSGLARLRLGRPVHWTPTGAGAAGCGWVAVHARGRPSLPAGPAMKRRPRRRTGNRPRTTRGRTRTARASGVTTAHARHRRGCRAAHSAQRVRRRQRRPACRRVAVNIAPYIARMMPPAAPAPAPRCRVSSPARRASSQRRARPPRTDYTVRPALQPSAPSLHQWNPDARSRRNV